jgi:hypothetical protein
MSAPTRPEFAAYLEASEAVAVYERIVSALVQSANADTTEERLEAAQQAKSELEKP